MNIADKQTIKDELRLACGSKVEIPVGPVTAGKDFLLIAGPCSVESEAQVMDTAEAVKRAGANMLRGGAFKLRTSPYTFQGLGERGLEYLAAAGKACGLPTVTEVTDPRDVELVCRYADVIQIGARSMQNYPLLSEAARAGKPVLLKRGVCATLYEFLCSAEYILSAGNPCVILCERGIRTAETYTRNTLDVGGIAALKTLTGLPVIADPSHAVGRAELVPPAALACVAAGCDGLMLEVHPHPQSALSDAQQQLDIPGFQLLAERAGQLCKLRNRWDI